MTMLDFLGGSAGLDLSVQVIVLLAFAGFAAGWVDAVVGGGGLIQLPALLLIPGISPVQALATNKVGSIMGTSVSAFTYYRRVHPDMRTALPMALAALLAAIGGARAAILLPAEALKPIVVVVLIGVGIYTAVRPKLGEQSALRWEGRKHVGIALLWGTIIGIYDGILGPGTGSFLVIALVGGLGYAFLPATAIAKVVNLATNLGALILFVPTGAVVWGVGLLIGITNIFGAYVGARMAVARGSRFVRIAFLCVVSVLIVRLIWDIATGN
jgi:uncharacterized membrane protein YfcA